jgi:hypothetical protein
MPKNEIDYSNTIIYKITCTDPNITDVYVGHTTNFVQRKHAHKASCINDKSANYKCKLYETIRCKGGWCNWKMEILNFFNCADHYEARKKEQEYFTLLNANLNSIEPLPKPKIKTNTTQIEEKEINKNIENPCPNMFYCEICDYKTANKKDFKKHNNTKKHLCNYNSMISIKKSQLKLHECKCGKSYNDNSGLWRHKKKCNIITSTNNTKTNEITNSQEFEKNIMFELLKQNQELQRVINELSLNNNTNNKSINTNSNN